MIRVEKGEDENDDVPDEPPPFQNEIDIVIRTWLEHKLHHTYPDVGGYLDQDSSLMDDWHIVNMYYSRVWHGVTQPVLIPKDAPSWLDGLENE